MKNGTNGRHVLINERDFDKLNELVHSPQLRSRHAPTVATLEQELDRSKPVSPTRVPKSVVTMNSQVRFRDLQSDEEETVTLVYPDAADIEMAKVSVLAPLGTALLGGKVGDVVECRAPAGVRKLKLEEILYQPEAAGDYHL